MATLYDNTPAGYSGNDDCGGILQATTQMSHYDTPSFNLFVTLHKHYDNTPAGYSGNDDCGEMSAWYVFNALGFYPVDPASGRYLAHRRGFRPDGEGAVRMVQMVGACG